MKTLQNNFTTPEQATILLLIGVPADSSDGFYSRESYRGGKWERPKLFESEKDRVNFNSVYEGGIDMYLPLYTVGRLNEIFKICSYNHIATYDLDLEGTQIERAMQAFENYAKYNWLDFSKLEE